MIVWTYLHINFRNFLNKGACGTESSRQAPPIRALSKVSVSFPLASLVRILSERAYDQL